MTENITPNQTAFIKISQELLMARNDLEAYELLFSAAGSITGYTKNKLAEHRGDKTHSKGLEGLSKAIDYLSHPSKLDQVLKDTRKKITELEILCETFMRGGDIIQAKLARD